MDFNVLEPTSFINQLKCSICQNYLSYFPILLTNNSQNICGRCEVPEDPQDPSKAVPNLRNEIYEIIAADIAFPCRYVREGCTKKLLAKDIPSHEKDCWYHLVKCPASLFDLCNESISLPFVNDHCMDKHIDKVLIDNFERNLFVIRLSAPTTQHECIVVTDDRCISFKTVFDSDSGNVSCILMCSENYENNFRLSLKTGTTSVVINFVKHRRSTYRCDFCINVFFESPGHNTAIQVSLLNQSKKEKPVVIENDLSSLLLNILKCFNCQKHIRPPEKIHFSTGNFYCAVCSKRRGVLVNDGFHHLVNTLDFPCKNQPNGCTYKSQLPQLEQHELRCSFQINDCPLVHHTQCDWTGFIHDSKEHIATKHEHNFADSSDFCINVRDGFGCYELKLSYILKFASHFFRLCFCVKKSVFYWSVQNIGEFQSGFWFEIEIVNSNNNQKLITRKACKPLAPERNVFDSFNNCCWFDVRQIEEMLSSKNELRFKVAIIKN